MENQEQELNLKSAPRMCKLLGSNSFSNWKLHHGAVVLILELVRTLLTRYHFIIILPFLFSTKSLMKRTFWSLLVTERLKTSRFKVWRHLASVLFFRMFKTYYFYPNEGSKILIHWPALIKITPSLATSLMAVHSPFCLSTSLGASGRGVVLRIPRKKRSQVLCSTWRR